MDGPILLGILVVAVVLTIVVMAVNRGRATPDQPLGSEPAERQRREMDPDPEDRPAGADAEAMAPRTGQLEPGDAEAAEDGGGAPDSEPRPPR